MKLERFDVNETLADKMKRFETEVNIKLEVKKPVIIRLDGKAFHTFTKCLDKPFDKDLSEIMQYTAMKLAEEIQNVKFIYSQSDEISILLTDWDNPNTDTWYGNRVQKMTSISASIATARFNQAIMKVISKYKDIMAEPIVEFRNGKFYRADNIQLEGKELKFAIWNSKQFQAMFDSRVFNLEPEEVSNYFLYRYMDAKRNSIQALAQSQFSHKQLNGKKVEDMIEMVKEKTGIDYKELPSIQKVGFAVYKDEEDKWKLDLEVPDIYENREYVEKWLK